MKSNQKRNLILSGGAFLGLALALIGCGGSTGTGSTGSTNTNGGTGGGTTQLTEIGINISRVEAVGSRFDTLGQADFKARVIIGGVSKDFLPMDGQDLIFPNWTFKQAFQVGQSSAVYQIYLWDDDSGLTGADDVADIDPKSTSAILSGTVNLVTGEVTGDLLGDVGDTFTVEGNDSKRAKISFQIFGS